MILSISGKIGSGKDTVGKIIQYLTSDYYPKKSFEKFIEKEGSEWSPPNTEWQIKKFADKLKDIVCLLIGCTREQLENETFKNTELGEEWLSYKSYKSNYQHPKLFINYEEAYKYSDELPHNIKEVILTPRLLLQLLGTECGRNIIHPNIWVNSLMSDYKSIGGYYTKNSKMGLLFTDKEGNIIHTELRDVPECDVDKRIYPNWIITDMRFPNELAAVKQREGITIRVNRNSNQVQNGMCITKCESFPNCKPCGEMKKEHPSETALDNAEFDYTIENNGTIEELIEKVRQILVKEKII